MTVRRTIFLIAALFSANVFAEWGLPGQTCTGSGGQNCDQALPDEDSTSSTMQVSSCPQLLDVVVGVDIEHTYIGDLEITLKSPGGTDLFIVTGTNCDEEDLFAVLDDDAPTPVDDECEFFTAPAIHGIFYPTEPLEAFNGESGNGTWTLTITDVAADDTGRLHDWTLDLVCHDASSEIISCDGFESCPTL